MAYVNQIRDGEEHFSHEKNGGWLRFINKAPQCPQGPTQLSEKEKVKKNELKIEGWLGLERTKNRCLHLGLEETKLAHSIWRCERDLPAGQPYRFQFFSAFTIDTDIDIWPKL